MPEAGHSGAVSFAYPGNSFHARALPVLAATGFKFARRGGSPEYPYDAGMGVAYEPGRDHSLLIPSVGDARPDWTLTDFTNALHRATRGAIPVLQFHGVPDRDHPWVHTPPERFREYMDYLKANGYQVLALRDLERYVDLAKQPSDPLARIQERRRAIGAVARSGQGAANRSKPAPPWDLDRLSQAPRWKALERPKSVGLQSISFEGLPFRGRATRVFAWLGIPPLPQGQRAPGMVLVHGGGGTAFEEWVRLWVDRGYAAIAMDTCGQIPVGEYGRWYRDEQGGPPGWGGLDQIDWPREDQWAYHAVADVLLAHSLLRSLPEVDPEKIGVTGISWGGYLTCIAAGVDRRFKLAVPVYGCGFYRETVFAASLQQLPDEKSERWLRWWDPSEYLVDATMPVLWVTGSNDFAYPLNALQLSYRLATGARWLTVRVRMPHGHGGAGEKPEEIRVFADSILKGGPELPRFVGTWREGAEVSASYAASVPVVSAELTFTKDDGRWQDRSWETLPAEVADGQIAATLPEGTKVYYLNLFDERGCAVSTEHEVLE